ncbi:uncharacterized protein TRIADDRAFT_34497, partial [Trichoplax adhaerens]
LQELAEVDKIFVIEVFSGCVRHRRILDVTIDRFYLKEGKTCLRAYQNLFKALCYIACFRMNEIGISTYSKLVMSQDPYKMMKFLTYLFNETYINTWLCDEWSKTYDPDYVQEELVAPMLK